MLCWAPDKHRPPFQLHQRAEGGVHRELRGPRGLGGRLESVSFGAEHGPGQSSWSTNICCMYSFNVLISDLVSLSPFTYFSHASFLFLPSFILNLPVFLSFFPSPGPVPPPHCWQLVASFPDHTAFHPTSSSAPTRTHPPLTFFVYFQKYLTHRYILIPP